MLPEQTIARRDPAALTPAALPVGRPGLPAVGTRPEVSAAGTRMAGRAHLSTPGLDGDASAPALWRDLLGQPEPSTAELQLLGALSVLRWVPAGQVVFERSQQAQAVVALVAGEVALGLRTADGTFRTERIVRAPAWLDQSSAWLNAPHAMDALAQSPARVLELPCAALAQGLASESALAQRLIRGLAREVQALAVNTHELMHKDAPARLAQWLSQRCEPVDGAQGQGVVMLNQRKRDVASQLAITPETLSRLMRSFTRQGVIEVSGYLVRVLDVAALGRLAQA